MGLLVVLLFIIFHSSIGILGIIIYNKVAGLKMDEDDVYIACMCGVFVIPFVLCYCTYKLISFILKGKDPIYSLVKFINNRIL